MAVDEVSSASMAREKQKKKLKNTLSKFIIDVILIVFTAWVTQLFTAQSEEDRYVKVMSERFDYIEENMSMDQAIDELTKKANGDATKYEADIKELREKSEDEIKELKEVHEAETKELKDKMSRMIEASTESPKLVVDGLESEANDGMLSNSMIAFGRTQYFSSDLINSIVEGNIAYSQEDNTVFYSSTNNVINENTKVSLFDTNVLYDGSNCQIVNSSDEKMIAIGSQKYAEGFILKRYPYSQDSTALFDLDGRYSQLSFDVGREVANSDMNDITLQAFLGEEFLEEYRIKAEDTIQHIDIPLSHAKTLKLSISDGSYVEYGFVNVTLSY